MDKQFCNYEISKKLKELWFNEPCFGYFAPLKTELTIWYNPEISNDGEFILAPLWQQVIDWLREKHRFHIQITPISYLNYTKIAYFYNIGGDDANKAIYDYQDKYGDILDASTQEVPGNYLNDELYDKNIFDMDFAYKTYGECREKAILKALEIIKSI